MGTTLSEVLVSTLVMSIGVVALATLFPISVLRSIQASQLTNAANLRYNAEAQIKSIPELLNIGEEWQPANPYVAGDVVVPSPTVRAKGGYGRAVFVWTGANGTSGSTEPLWQLREGATNTVDDPAAPPTVTPWQTVTVDKYIVDPLGYLIVDPADSDSRFRIAGGGALTGTQQHFGNLNGTPFNPLLNRFPAFGLFRFSDSATLNEARAAAASVLPDSWTLQVESLELTALNNTNGTIDLLNVDPAVVSSTVQVPASGPDLVPDRIVMTDETGHHSHMRYLTATPTAMTGGTRITWGTGKSLPTGFNPVKARVESLERRYSYILSVRRPNGVPHTDVVVFFRRTYSPRDEQVYPAVFRKIDRGSDLLAGNAGVNDNNNGLPAGPKNPTDEYTELGWAGSDDKPRSFTILQYDSTAEKPFYKKGGFICDALNLRWYRIIDVYEDPFPLVGSQSNRIGRVTPAGYEPDPAQSGADRAVRLTLNQTIVDDYASINTTTMAPISVSGIQGGAILMRGVVDVFPLRARQPWEE